MKKTLIMVVAPITIQVASLDLIKEQISKYLGERMIEDNPQDYPTIKLNCLLSPEDIKTIVNIVGTTEDRCTILFLESENDFNSTYYVLDIDK